MGYESKLIVVQQSEFKLPNKSVDCINCVICVFEMCKLGYDFNYKIFNEELKGKLYPVLSSCECDEPITEDCYGEKLKCTSDLNKVIRELNKLEKKEHYRRLNPFISMLKVFNKQIKNKEWGKILIVHYGH